MRCPIRAVIAAVATVLTLPLLGLVHAPSASTATRVPGAAAVHRAAGDLSGCFPSPDGSLSVCMNSPATRGWDSAVSDGVLAQVARAGAGDSIRVAMFRWDFAAPTDAIIAAQRRGAHVEIVADRDVRTNVFGRRALDTIEAGDPQRNNVVVCSGSCLPWTGRGPAPPSQNINHHKLYLFDLGGERSVAVTSANLERRMDGQYNSMLRTTDPAMWRFHRRYFKRLKAQSWLGWGQAARSSRGGGAQQAFAYPRRTDPVLRILRSVRCVPGARQVDIAVAVIQRHGVRRELGLMARRGCRLRVVTTRDTIENWLQAPVPQLDGTTTDLPDKRVRTLLIHDKIYAIHAKVGGRVRRLVLTGTSNSTCGGLLYNDEVMWRVESSWAWKVYQRHFRDIYRHAHQSRTRVMPQQRECG